MKLLELICDFASVRGLPDSFLVGGTVRDMLLDREVKDVDIVVKGDAFDIGRSFADDIGGSFVILDEDFAIARVVKDHEFIDICRMRGQSITDDLADRDLTINAIAIPLLKLESLKPEGGRESLNKVIIDPFNGLNDLKYGTIRMVSEENLVNDPLRLLRAYRFSATLSFQIEVQTSKAVKTHAALISNAAAERIAEELRFTLMADDSYSAIKEMEKDGLLLHLFPELKEFSIETWNHCRQSYGYVEHILRNLPLYFPGRGNLIWDYFAEKYRIFSLKLSVLFQDEEIAGKVTDNLKLSRKEAEFVRLILSHSEVVRTLDSAEKLRVIGLLYNFGDDIYSLLIYALASTRVCQLSENPLLALAREIVSIYHDEFIPRQKKLPFINGNDLIEEFGLTPSPAFKVILSAIELLALEGTVTSHEEALRAAGEMIKEGYHS
jgi:tRNA nucleotidyltransferase/poly(A) polymerase